MKLIFPVVDIDRVLKMEILSWIEWYKGVQKHGVAVIG